jgi:hypothetical protein
MLSEIAIDDRVSFRNCDEVRVPIREACEQILDIAKYLHLGNSEEGRPIDAVILGNGPKRISLLAGAHSDEPVGPETLRTLILEGLGNREALRDPFERYRFFIIPHINPDGEARNRIWIKQFPDMEAYLKHVFREPPGRDLEFGYPDMREENRLVSAFLKDHAPFHLHINLHGMGFSEGAMLLIERHWINRSGELQKQFAAYAQESGLKLHDHNRKGEKGFVYIGPGFTTTPEGRAMQAYFRSLSDEETAGKLHLSSMEYVRTLGGNPLCLVTELPLFVIGKKAENPLPGVPVVYLEFLERLPKLRLKASAGESLANAIEEFQIRPLDLNTAARFQLYTIQLGLEMIG